MNDIERNNLGLETLTSDMVAVIGFSESMLTVFEELRRHRIHQYGIEQQLQRATADYDLALKKFNVAWLEWVGNMREVIKE